MKRFIVALMLAFALADGRARAEPVQVDGVAAWVDGRAITVMDVLLESQPLFAGLVQEKGLSRTELNARRLKIFQQVRRNLVDTELIYASFQRDKEKAQIAVTDQMVDSRIDEIVQSDFNGSREMLMKALAGERQTFEEWRDKMARRIIVQGLRTREVVSKAQVSPRQVRDYYDAHRSAYSHPGQVLLRRIVIAGENAEERARRLMDRLYAGDEFADLAGSFSSGPEAKTGGLWGWRILEDLSPALREKLNGIPVNGTFKIDLGGDWHIVRLEGRETESFEEARGEIEELLRRQEIQRLHELWMTKLEREIHVTLIDQRLWEE